MKPRVSSRTKVLLLLAEVIAIVDVLVLVSHGSSGPPPNVGEVPAAGGALDANSLVVPQSTSRTTPAVPDTVRPDAKTVGHRPRRLSLAAVGIDAAVIPVSVNARGGLTVPEDVDRLGWWSSGAAPGASSGTVVIDGHVDSAVQGIGEFFYLERATPGAVVVVSTARGDVRYRVAARVAYKKAALPREIFSRTGRSRLVLITCGGSFDSKTRNYADNVVVYALPI